jgi:uroporphyrinogen decarboxylase
MNGRERLLVTLNGDISDQVPVSLFVQEEFLSYMYPGRKVDRVKDAVECAKFFGFDIMTRSKAFNIPYFMKKSYPNWNVSFSTMREAGNYYEIFEVKTPLKTLKQVEVGPDVGDAVSGLHLSTKEYLIKDESDLEAFMKYVPSVDARTISDMKEYCKWSKKIIGELGISAPWGIGGIYNLAATYRDVTQLMMDPYINADFYEAYMNKLTDLAVAHDGEFAAANSDVIGIQGNIANAAVIGSSFFDEFILPYEKKLVEAISGAGSFTVYHNCGRAEVLQKSYVEMGLSAWETVAEAPQGDNCLERAKKNVGDRITLIGNLDQVNFLKTATTAEVEERTEEVMKVGKPGGRYIFACSDFLEKDTPFDNIKAMVRTARLHARY